MNSCFSIESIGNALLHWTSYLCDVRRSAILNEGSIKYGISELLEVFKGRQDDSFEKRSLENGYIPYIKDYEFEFNHPYYTGRRVDLSANICSYKKTNQWLFEFKYLTSSSGYTQEFSRYLDDIIRLFSFHINSETKNARTFFMVFGKHDAFVENFYNKKPSNFAEISKGYKSEEVKTRKANSKHNLSAFLGIDDNEEKVIRLNELQLSEKSSELYINDFNKRYEDEFKVDSKKKNIKIHTIVSENEVIKTRLVYPQLGDKSGFVDSPVDVYIWEIYA